MLWKYLLVAFIAGLLYGHIPQDKNPLKNNVSFIIFAVLVFYFVDTSYLKEKFLEKYDNMVNPVGIGSAARQEEIARLEASLSQMKQVAAQEIQAQTDPSVSASKQEQVQKLEEERNKIAAQYKGASEQELASEQQKLASMQQRLVDIANMEQQISSLKLQSQQTPSMPAVSQDPSVRDTHPADSCNCETKIEKVLNDYINKGKIMSATAQKQNEMMFSQLAPQQMEPLGSYGDGFTNKFDHGFTYLNTTKWAPPVGRVPVCKTEQKCPVCPVMTSGYPLSVMEFDNARKIMPPDNINVDYIKDMLNK